MPVSVAFPAARLEGMHAYMQRFAGTFGVEIGQPTRIPNTRRALAVGEYARDQGKLFPFRDAMMAAHWHDDRDIEDPEVVGDIAESVGLDRQAALAARTDDTYLARVDEMREEAHHNGVSGIPTFFFGDIPVVGCQSYELLARAARAAGFAPR